MAEFSDLPSGERKSKDIIFGLLADYCPLTIAGLQQRLKEKHGVKMTYQAVRKAVRGLQSRGVVTHGEGGYALSQAWLLRTKRMIDQLLSQQQRRTGKAYDKVLSEDYSSYAMGSLFELDNFWFQVLEQAAQQLLRSSEREILCVNNYCWWMLINLGQETSLYKSFIDRGCRVSVLILQSLPLNAWASKIYRSVGVRVRSRSIRDASGESNVDINILGDTIIRVTYPLGLMKKIRDLVTNVTSIDKLDTSAMTRLAHAKSQIRLTVQKDADLARSLRSFYLP